MMCASRLVLILSIRAASVVDLPLPVGPVTRIRPLFLVNDRGLLYNYKYNFRIVDEMQLTGISPEIIMRVMSEKSI